MNSLIWIEARTAEQAVAEMAQDRAPGRSGPAVLKAGGIDLLDRMKEGIDNPVRLINLRRVKGHGMDQVREVRPEPTTVAMAKAAMKGDAGSASGTELRIGALVTLARLAEDPLVRKHFPALAQAAEGAATPQIRQVATLGGNLLQRPRCWYLRSKDHLCKKKGGTMCFAQTGENDFHAIFDNGVCAIVHPSAAATPLWALAARVRTIGPKGERDLTLAELFMPPGEPGANLLRENHLDPAEVLTEVVVPLPQPGQRNLYLKVKQKQSFDWPLGEVAVVLRAGARGSGRAVAAARIVLGSAAAIPWRAEAAEAELLGLSRIDEAGLQKVGRAAVAGALPLGKNGYKVPLLSGLVQRAVAMALSGASEVTR
jgi:xanthine dehydrogenase YagS FAD-binding subunit